MSERVHRTTELFDVVARQDDRDPIITRPMKCDECGAEVQIDYSCKCAVRARRDG